MTTITELDIYRACHGTYEDDYPFDLLFQGAQDDDTFVGVKRFGPIDVVAFRGSTTPEDWVRNFETIPVHDPMLGWISAGFVIGLQPAIDNLATVLGSHVIVTGHSRGAALATTFAAKLVAMGRPPLALVPFAPPRTGGDQLHSLISSIKTVRAYSNKGDPVPDVPPWCSHPYPLIGIDVPPPANDPWGPVAPHHSELYGQAIAALDPMPTYEVAA